MKPTNTTTTILHKIVGKVRIWLFLNVVLFLGFVCIELLPCAKPHWWIEIYPLATSLLTGGLVSFFFYWLVVYLPERKKRRIIKNNFSKMYRRIKKDLLYQVVFASIEGGRTDLQAGCDDIDNLMVAEAFKETFSGGREANEGFYAFENQMSNDTPEFRAIVMNLEMLAKQIEFVLHNYSIDNEKAFDFFKRLEMILLSMRRSSPGYDESKPLCRFIFEIFSGFYLMEGHLGYDVIEKMIADI